MAKTNDLKVLHEAVVGRTIPMEMDFDPKELSDQYAHTPYIDPKCKLYGMPDAEESQSEGE